MLTTPSNTTTTDAFFLHKNPKSIHCNSLSAFFHLSMAPAALHLAARSVCVIDASGQIGKSIVRRLLRRGYTVHAATRSPAEMNGLKSGNFEKNKRLMFFRYDPFDYQSIVDAMRGCSGLFYTFEPPRDQPTYDEYMVEMEVRAAHNVLEACAQTDTMEKVVFTSSVTAVIWKENHKSLEHLDERNWSDPNFCRKFKLWHGLSKTLAEKTAWALAMDRDVNMVSVNGGLLITGSELTITNPYLKGAAEMYKDGVFVTVDAEFLADAHICVYEDPSSYGRYLCFDHLIGRPEDAVKLAQTLAPSSSCPPPNSGDSAIRQRIHSKKLNKLMLCFDGQSEHGERDAVNSPSELTTEL